MSVNKAILVGNVGKDPETRQLDSGSVSRFSMATSESYKNKQGEKITNTDWHNIVCWNNLSDIVEKYVSKGSQLYIEGHIKNRSYETKEGEKRYITEIVADKITMLGKKKEGDAAKQAEHHDTSELPPSENLNDVEEDDLPF